MIMTLDSHISVEDLDHNAEGGGGLEYELIFMDGSDFIFLFGIIVPKLELKVMGMLMLNTQWISHLKLTVPLIL